MTYFVGRVLEAIETPDGAGGTLEERTTQIECPDCKGRAVQCMLFVTEKTKAPNLVALGLGASVKHFYTSCQDCGGLSAS